MTERDDGGAAFPQTKLMFGFLNDLARQRGMPENYEIFSIQMMGKARKANAHDDPNAKVKVTGDRPMGIRFDGRPIWPRGKAQGAAPKSVIITITEYRQELAKQATLSARKEPT